MNALNALKEVEYSSVDDYSDKELVVVVSARKADGARPRQRTQHSMRSDTK